MKNKTGVRRLLEIAGERSGLLIVSAIFSAISAVFMLVPYIAVYFILAELLHNVENISAADSTFMENWGWLALAGLGAGMVFLYCGIMASHIAAFRILYGLRVRLAQHIGKLHLGYLTKTSTGAVKKTLEQNVEKIEKFIAHQIPDIINVFATVILMFAIMFYLNGWMSAVCVISFVIGVGIQVSMMFGEDAKQMITKYHDSLENINTSAIEYVRGMPAVKLFGQTVRSFKKFHADLVHYRDFATAWTDSFQNGYLVFKTILASFLTLILPVGVLLLSREPQNMSLALTIIFFLVMTPATATPLYKLLFMSSMLKDINEGVNRMDAIFKHPEIAEPVQPRSPAGHDITFSNVSFSYDAAEASTRTNALAEISFHAKQGTTTALVGPSGSGKSTIANLIPRFWDVVSGSIEIGGVNIKDISSEKLMDTVSFVFQDTFLFYDSLYENIRIGRPDATRQEIEEAARAAQCHDFIECLTEGYETRIGEGGVHLSGGEEQRVSVARAILKDAPILVLDEATAFADPENEHKMHLAIRELIKNKTVIVIAHRLSTICNADQIIVLNNGRIEEQGKHAYLLDNGGLYKRMWDTYSATSIWGFRQQQEEVML